MTGIGDRDCSMFIKKAIVKLMQVLVRYRDLSRENETREIML